MAGVGRPRLPDDERKDERAYAYLTKKELRQLDARAKKLGISRMGLLRRLIAKYMRWKG